MIPPKIREWMAGPASFVIASGLFTSQTGATGHTPIPRDGEQNAPVHFEPAAFREICPARITAASASRFSLIRCAGLGHPTANKKRRVRACSHIQSTSSSPPQVAGGADGCGAAAAQ